MNTGLESVSKSASSSSMSRILACALTPFDPGTKRFELDAPSSSLDRPCCVPTGRPTHFFSQTISLGLSVVATLQLYLATADALAGKAYSPGSNRAPES